MISHLLDNAIEASAGRPVRIRVRHEALSVLIDIIDQGPGMAPEFIRDSLFRPFATTKQSGHGIGVYQARELLREAGGDLLALSRVTPAQPCASCFRRSAQRSRKHCPCRPERNIKR